jgi:exoribonuclease-2
MHVLFEEDGAFKTATILTDNDTSLQVETASGKRAKIKSANVLLRYKEPAPGELLLDAENRWPRGSKRNSSGSARAMASFLFVILPTTTSATSLAVEATALLLALHSAPVYFHRKGKGRFRKAPADILAAALAGLEKKRQQALAIERMVGELKAFSCRPSSAAARPAALQARPQPPETKALEAACSETGLSAPHLLDRCGAIRRRTTTTSSASCSSTSRAAPAFPASSDCRLPDAAAARRCAAFRSTTPRPPRSTTPSRCRRPGIGWRVGIHIAAPGLGIAPARRSTRSRATLSTVYMPGNKITMLPDAAVERFTLAAGRDCPALSLYLT